MKHWVPLIHRILYACTSTGFSNLFLSSSGSFALSLADKFNVDTAIYIRPLWVAQDLTTPLGFPIREQENNQDKSWDLKDTWSLEQDETIVVFSVTGSWSMITWLHHMHTWRTRWLLQWCFCGQNLPVTVSKANLPTLRCGAFKRLVYAISRLSISGINCQLLDVRIGDEDNAKAKESTENRKTERGKS